MMGFIDTLRREGHAVESTCRVLTEQGCRVAARTYRSRRDTNRPVAARAISDAQFLDASATSPGRSTIGEVAGSLRRGSMDVGR